MTNSRGNFFLLSMFYLVAHGGILLIPNAIYWDDWILYRVDPEIILNTFKQAGSMFNVGGFLHKAMLDVGPWIYKVLTFWLMFASGILLNSILKRYENIATETRFFIVLLFLLLPFNLARVALIDFPYTLCYFLFFLAWQLMDRFRIAALALFFLSFNTNSLLVIYALPVLDMLYRSGHLASLKSALGFGIRRIDYLLLPFVYFFVKFYFFAPSGLYEGYNQSYSTQNLMESAILQRDDFFHLFKLLREVVGVELWLFLSLFVFLFVKNKPLIATPQKWISWGLLAIGLLAFFLGAFPYWILGYVPTFNDWSSRHQLLLPLGSALIIVGILSFNNLNGKTKAHSIIIRGSQTINASVISIIVGASLAFNVSSYATLFIDWQKQKQLIHLFSKNADLERAGLVVFVDATEQLNGLGRKQRSYEWNGMLEAAFGNQKRFAIQQSQSDDYLSGNLDRYFQSEYKAGSFRKNVGLPSVLVEINLAKPGNFREKIMNSVFPKLTLSVSEIDLTNSRKQ